MFVAGEFMKKILQVLMLVFVVIFQALSTSASVSNIGQRFIVTLPENQDFHQLAKWLEQIKPGGVMLTAQHVKNRTHTKKLCFFLQETARKLEIDQLFICIDWEGGIVSRPNESGGFFSIPSPWSLAQAGRSACFLAGMLIGHQLHSIGVNVNFAPSLDLFTRQNYILATRCFDANPEKVAEYGIAFAQGLLSQGVLPVIKHFPGLGLGVKDTHLDQTIISVDKDLFDQHKKPFETALQAGIPIVMAGHAIYRQFGDQPVTVNKNATNYLKKINSDILLITDDFCMQGVRENRTLEDAFKQSLEAGYHLIIFSPAHAPEFIKKSSSQVQLQTLLKNLSLICDKTQVDNGIKQISRIKEKYLAQNASSAVIDEKQLSMFLAKRCLQIDSIKQPLTGRVTLISAKLTAIRTAEQWLIQDEQSYLCKQLKNQDVQVQEHILDPVKKESTKELEALIEKIKPTEKIVVQTIFYGGGAWNAIQKKWLEKLMPFQNQLIIVSLGHPYEQTILPDATGIHVGSFQKPLLDNLVEVLCGQPLQTGADKLVATPERFLTGKKFGLLCHKCSVAQQDGVSKFLPDILKKWADQQKKPTQLGALFSPEHGLLGTQEAFAFINSEQKSQWHCPNYSLPGSNKKPTPDMLKNLDLLIIDLQEVGTRCFTYLSSMKLVLEAAAEGKIPVLVLDRPNPLALWGAAGPDLEPEHESFLGKAQTQFLHGSTIGKIAQLMNQKIGADLKILSCSNLDDDYFLSRAFIPPSPNIMSIDHAFAYPMTVFIEGVNYSEGRGTNYPFLQIGAPWVDAQQLALTLNQKKLPGVYFEPMSFTPRSIAGVADKPKYQDTLCHGVFIHIHNRKKIEPMLVAQTILETLFRLYPEKSQWIAYGKRYALDLLIGTSSWRKQLESLKRH